jgi:multimeric flavodoxin WrbA
MKIIAINSSPNMGKGNTALVLDPFLEGTRQAGAEVELFYTKKLTINPCQGEYNCWYKSPGKCFQQDDMEMLLPRVAQADVLVLATPVYVDGVSGPMKNLLDRLLPLLHPSFELRDGHCRHPRRDGARGDKLVLVSNCGFWEKDNFEPMLVHMEALCKNAGREFAGALLRPHGPVLRAMVETGAAVDDIFEAAKEAGRQLVEDGKMSPQTLDVVSRDLLPLKMYVQIVNQRVHEKLEAL